MKLQHPPNGHRLKEELARAVARAEAAERDLAAAQARIAELEAQLAAQAWRPVTEDLNKDTESADRRMMEISTYAYRYCSECLRRGIPLVSVGGMDSQGHVDQESGADLCADCLRKALAMLEEPTATE